MISISGLPIFSRWHWNLPIENGKIGRIGNIGFCFRFFVSFFPGVLFLFLNIWSLYIEENTSSSFSLSLPSSPYSFPGSFCLIFDITIQSFWPEERKSFMIYPYYATEKNNKILMNNHVHFLNLLSYQHRILTRMYSI